MTFDEIPFIFNLGVVLHYFKTAYICQSSNLHTRIMKVTFKANENLYEYDIYAQQTYSHPCLFKDKQNNDPLLDKYIILKCTLLIGK